jgi:hypothetical protein
VSRREQFGPQELFTRRLLTCPRVVVLTTTIEYADVPRCDIAGIVQRVPMIDPSDQIIRSLNIGMHWALRSKWCEPIVEAQVSRRIHLPGRSIFDRVRCCLE